MQDEAGTGLAADPAFCGTRWYIGCLSQDAHIDLSTLLGQPVLLELLTDASRTDLRPFHGHITHVEQLGANGGLARYQLTVEPWLAFLAQRQDSASFQDMQVFDILDSIFRDYQGQGALQPQWRFDIADKSAYPKRSLTTQYQETDLAFITRLMAEEGLFAWVEHKGDANSPALGTHTVVIADHNGAFQPNASANVAFTQPGAVMQRDSVDRWRSLSRWQARMVQLSTWDYRGGTSRPALASNTGNGEFDATGAIPLVHRDAPGAYAFETPAQGQRLARNQLQALDVARQLYTGAGTVRSFGPGTHFVLSGQADLSTLLEEPPEDERRYTLLRVVHLAHNNLSAELRAAVDQRLGGEQKEAPGINAKSASGAGTTSASSYLFNSMQEALSNLSGSDKPLYRNRVDAIRNTTPYRGSVVGSQGQLLHPKPSVYGQQTAVVVGPTGQVVYTDRDHRVKVQFHWQRDAAGQYGSHSRQSHPSQQGQGGAHTGAPANEQSGTWVRVAASLAPTAGANWGAVAIPRIGQEVWVDFIEGDIDRPAITGSVYNGQGTADAQYNQAPSGAGSSTGNAPAWFPGEADGHAHPAALSGIKTQALSASQQGAGGYNQLVFDDSAGQARTALQSHASPHQGTAELNLGQLRHQSDNQRLNSVGFGAELKTPHSHASRAGAGMLLSTDARTNASRTQLDSQEAIAQAQASQQLHTSLAETAQKHKAELKAQPEPAKLPAVEQQARSINILQTQDQDATAYSEPLLQLSGAAGVAVATPESAIYSAGNTSSIAAGNAINLAAQGNSHHLVKDGISFFTYGKVSNASQPNQETGIALHSASGKVSSQSQSGQTRLTANQGITVASVTGAINVSAQQHVLLTAGGAGLRIEGGNITIQGPGTMAFKGSAVELTGPRSVSPSLPEFPTSTLNIKKTKGYRYSR